MGILEGPRWPQEIMWCPPGTKWKDRRKKQQWMQTQHMGNHCRTWGFLIKELWYTQNACLFFVSGNH